MVFRISRHVGHGQHLAGDIPRIHLQHFRANAFDAHNMIRDFVKIHEKAEGSSEAGWLCARQFPVGVDFMPPI